MIPFPAYWVRHQGIQITTAYPPTGGGRFRYWERLTPMPSFAGVIDHVLRSDPLFRVSEIDEPVRVVTQEGEYGAWTSVTGRREDRSAMRFVGAIFTGDFAAALDTIVILRDRFAEFERRSLDLLRQARFGYGRRPRLFFYSPPPGWQAIPSGLAATWYPPDFPKLRANIVVPPATPVDLTVEAAAAELAAEIAGGTEPNTDGFTSTGGQRGVYIRAACRTPRGEPLHREASIFIVDGQQYYMRLETMVVDIALGELFRAVAASFQPLPTVEERRFGRAFGPSPAILDHWAV